MADNSLIADKIRGMLWGGVFGDCIGASYEGAKHAVQITELTDLSITDDSQLTLATCKSIYDTKQLNPECVAEEFCNWFKANKITGIGASTLKAVKDLSAGSHWALAGRSGEYAAGNGAAMRIAPLALLLNPFSDEDRVLVKDICRITHNNDEAYIGALVIMMAIYLNMDDTEYNSDKLFYDIVPSIPDSRVRDRLVEIDADKDLTIEQCINNFGNSGYVVESVPLVIFLTLKLGMGNFLHQLHQIVRFGGDADTIASMYGQIVGARFGYEYILNDKFQLIQDNREIHEIIENFIAFISKQRS